MMFTWRSVVSRMRSFTTESAAKPVRGRAATAAAATPVCRTRRRVMGDDVMMPLSDNVVASPEAEHESCDKINTDLSRGPQGLVEVQEEVVHVLDPGGQAQQVRRARRSRALDRGAVLDEALH